jgi:hypothetical protein
LAADGSCDRVDRLRCPRVGGDRVSVLAQGTLLKVQRVGAPPCGGGVRGEVRGLSYGSRKRWCESCARLTDQKGCLMLDTTYPDPVPLPPECHRDLAALWKRVKRRYPRASAHWMFEMNSEGERDYHPHFHLLIYGVPYIDVQWIRDAWAEVIGAPGFVWIQPVDSWMRSYKYQAKYLSKGHQQPSLDYLTYLTGDCLTGRMWGVLGREYLPVAELVEVAHEVAEWFFDLKRSARHVWPGVSGHRWAGFSLFVDNPLRWLDLVAFYLGSSASDVQ